MSTKNAPAADPEAEVLAHLFFEIAQSSIDPGLARGRPTTPFAATKTPRLSSKRGVRGDGGRVLDQMAATFTPEPNKPPVAILVSASSVAASSSSDSPSNLASSS